MPRNATPDFRLRGKYLFLTYSQVEDGWTNTLWKNEFLGRLPEMLGGVIGTERHADGGLHKHVCLELGRRIDTTNPRFFDFLGSHPNVQVARSWLAVLRYATKDGDWEGFGKYEHFDRSNYEGEDEPEIVRAKYAREEETYLQSALERRIPYGYAARFWSLATAHQTPEIRTDDDVSGSITFPYLQYLMFDKDSRQALIILGPTGAGKSVWARKHAPRPALIASHIEDLRCFRKGYHKSIVFDDMDFNHFPRTAQIHLVDFDQDRRIHARYNNVSIPAGVHRIFTCNQMPLMDDPAIRRRIHVLDLYNLQPTQ